MRILLVEDEEDVASLIKRGLGEQTFTVDVAVDGLKGEQMVRDHDYDAIILDVMLPHKSGFAVCRAIRKFNGTVPILMLTALGSIDDKSEGFGCGADDYLVKPFDIRELLMRLQALLRRRLQPNQDQESILVLADLALDTVGKTVKRNGQTIALTAREYALLEYLLRNSNRIISRMDIADNIWDNPNALDSKTIEVFISFLRRKIDKPFDKKLIHTVVGMGYVMKDEEQNL